MGNVFKYLSLAIELAGVVEAFIVMASAGQAISKEQLAEAVGPVLATVEMLWPKAKLPRQLLDDIEQAVVTAVNNYLVKGQAQAALAAE